jgi:purine-binding chemotaxis protein CheW
MEKEQLTTKILTFSMGSEYYGIQIEKVREIIRYENLTSIHDSQKYIMGVINLRGKIIPVMDLRLKFGLEFKEYTDKTVLIILEIQGNKGDYQMALSVDAVHEVVVPTGDDMEKTPGLGLNLKRDYLVGILKTQEKMIMILDINKIVMAEEIVDLKEVSKE